MMILLQLDWKPFTKEDWWAWAGAGENAQIAHLADKTYIRSEEDGVLYVEEYGDSSGLPLRRWEIRSIDERH